MKKFRNQFNYLNSGGNRMKHNSLRRQLMLSVGIMLLLVCIGAYRASAQLTILVNKGKFATLEEAANADEKVNWIDADRTDDRACTECFAATELVHFLPLGSTVSASEIKVETNGKVPSQG